MSDVRSLSPAALRKPVTLSRPIASRRDRDSIKQRVYDAENATFTRAHGESNGLADAKRFPTLAAVAKYANSVLQSAHVRKHFPRAPRHIAVERGISGCKSTAHDAYKIRMAPQHWNRPVILHELAHALTLDDPGHGRAFARAYHGLVRRFIGADVATRLAEQFKRFGVKYSKPRTVVAGAAAEAIRGGNTSDARARMAKLNDARRAAKLAADAVKHAAALAWRPESAELTPAERAAVLPVLRLLAARHEFVPGGALYDSDMTKRLGHGDDPFPVWGALHALTDAGLVERMKSGAGRRRITRNDYRVTLFAADWLAAYDAAPEPAAPVTAPAARPWARDAEHARALVLAHTL